MRPEILFPLFKEITSISGIGPRLGKRIEILTGPKCVDSLWHLPSDVIDRRYSPKINEAIHGVIATMILEVVEHTSPRVKTLPYKVRCRDGTGTLDLIFFKGRRDYLLKKLPIGELRVVSGKVEKFCNQLQIIHPDYVEPHSQLSSLKRIEPVYPLTAGVTAKVMNRVINSTLNSLPKVDEWIDPNLMKAQKWPPWNEAISAIHKPATLEFLDPQSFARRRLAYDEILANQVILAITRKNTRLVSGESYISKYIFRDQLLNHLQFELTNSQKSALLEIEADLISKRRMLRLLQGDVGSGKTIVALLAMLTVVECGFQAVMMAPTEILANQHCQTLEKLVKPLNIDVLLLTGSDNNKSKKNKLQALSDGEPLLIVGTHALFQKGVHFGKLGFVVIDEQHRFGVHQRLNLSSKGRGVDVLVMTATPIPRTLMLTSYGDMDVSVLAEKPIGRKPIDTRIIPVNRIDEVMEAVGRSINSGEKVYWVCPVIEDSKVNDLAAAEERYDSLCHFFPERVGLLHGRLSIEKKKDALKKFQTGLFDIMVSTTVIEVGVDVSNATVIIIEHAERFGLAQLHQLRGRVGRNSKTSNCILLYSNTLSTIARARLQVLRDTQDGFKIAEEDLKLRGGGELLGTRQSGLPDYRLANLAIHEDLLRIANKDALNLLNQDPELETARGESIRFLLHLFNQAHVADNLRAG